jgi:hypothetical protein
MHYPSSMETNARWYNKNDSAHFRRVCARDVMKCSRLVIVKIEQNGHLGAKERVQFIGLEQDVSFNMKQTLNRFIIIRKNHIYMILMEQE